VKSLGHDKLEVGYKGCGVRLVITNNPLRIIRDINDENTDWRNKHSGIGGHLSRGPGYQRCI
jgi:hypothetical protein